MGNNFNPDFAAVVLIEAIYTGDAVICQKYGIAERTLYNYRKRLTTDTQFADIFRIKKQLLDNAWADELRVALHKGIKTLGECMEAISADPAYKKNPMVVSAVAGAIKLCAEVEMTGRLIDARLAPEDRAPDSVFKQSDTGQESTAIN